MMDRARDQGESNDGATKPTAPRNGNKRGNSKRRLPTAYSRNPSSSASTNANAAPATTAASSPLPPLPHSFSTMKHMNFARKLYEIVNYTTNQTNGNFLDYSKILSWHPDRDTTFVVWDKEQFMKHVAPRFFPTQNAFRSLERLLNMWTFVRVPEEENRLGGSGNSNSSRNIRVFSQPDFSRSDASRLRNIERRNVPKAGNNNVPPPNRKAQPQSMVPILPRGMLPPNLSQQHGDVWSAAVPIAAAVPGTMSQSTMMSSQQQHFNAAATGASTSDTPTNVAAAGRSFQQHTAGRKRTRDELGSLSQQPNCSQRPVPSPPRQQRWQVSGQFDDADDNNEGGESNMDDDEDEDDDALIF